ncbi:hypothetical protein D021_4879B, partial [Vibrio parahaemolyticus 10296]
STPKLTHIMLYVI